MDGGVASVKDFFFFQKNPSLKKSLKKNFVFFRYEGVKVRADWLV